VHANTPPHEASSSAAALARLVAQHPEILASAGADALDVGAILEGVFRGVSRAQRGGGRRPAADLDPLELIKRARAASNRARAKR
jgi:hypothetical protein